MDEILHTLQKLFSYAYKLISIAKKSLYSISTLSEKWWYFLLTNLGTLTLTIELNRERQSARVSKITNDCLTRSGTGCFIAVPIYCNSGRQRVKRGRTMTSIIRSTNLSRCSL